MHLNKRLPNGERRQYNLTEEEFHDLSFQFQRFSGAMLANLVNTAVILAGRQGRTVITHDDLVEVRACFACFAAALQRSPVPRLAQGPAPVHGRWNGRAQRLESTCNVSDLLLPATQ